MAAPCRTPAEADGPMSLGDFLALEAEEGWRQEIVDGWPARFPFPSLIEEDLRDWLREQLRP